MKDLVNKLKDYGMEVDGLEEKVRKINFEDPATPILDRKKALLEKKCLVMQILFQRMEFQIVDLDKFLRKTGLDEDVTGILRWMFEETEMYYFRNGDFMSLALKDGFVEKVKEKLRSNKTMEKFLPGYEIKRKFLPEQEDRRLVEKISEEYECLKTIFYRATTVEQLKKDICPLVFQLKKDEMKNK